MDHTIEARTTISVDKRCTMTAVPLMMVKENILASHTMILIGTDQREVTLAIHGEIIPTEIELRMNGSGRQITKAILVTNGIRIPIIVLKTCVDGILQKLRERHRRLLHVILLKMKDMIMIKQQFLAMVL